MTHMMLMTLALNQERCRHIYHSVAIFPASVQIGAFHSSFYVNFLGLLQMVFDIMSCLFNLYLHGNFFEANVEIQLTNVL